MCVLQQFISPWEETVMQGDWLLSVEMAYRTNLKLYTSGHLKAKEVCKPSEKIKQGWWSSARKQTCFIIERNQFAAENESARKIRRFSGNFSSSIPLLPAKPAFFCPNNRHPQSPVTCVSASADFSIPLEILKLKALKRKEEGTDRFHESHQKRWVRCVRGYGCRTCQRGIPVHPFTLGWCSWNWTV